MPRPGRLTARGIERLARAGESEHLEYKGRRASIADVVDAVVCFANGDGGLVLLGIDDDGTIGGTNLRDVDALRKAIFNGTSPSRLVETQLVDVAGKRIMGIWVEHSDVLVSTTGGSYTQRVGKDCLPMTPDRLIVRQIDTRALDFSAAITPVGLAGVDELEVERFRRLLPNDEAGERLRRLDTPSLLAALGALAATSSGAQRLTVAGLLLFASEAGIRATLPQHQVVYLRSPAGTSDYERRVVTSQPVLRLLEQLTLEVGAASKSRTLRFGPRDLELPDYPDRVLREAIINALAHRHYTLPGDTVIRQTAGALEIENPGGFPEGIGPETVIQHAPVHRNRLLCELLDRVRVMERAGLGVDRIFEDQLRSGKVPPAYDADRTSVRLRLDAREFDEPFARMVLAEEQAGRQWRVEELLVASHLHRMGPSDRATLARVMQRAEEEGQEILSALLGDLIVRFGSGPGTRYVLSPRIQALLGAEATYTRERGLAKEAQRGLVLQHAREFGRVDNQTVRDLLQVSQREATLLLQGLESRGDLVIRGSRRWAYYEPVERPTLDL